MGYCKKCNNIFHGISCDCTKKDINSFSARSNNIDKCGTCKGTGRVLNQGHRYYTKPDGFYQCPHCGGTGKIK